MVVLGNLVVLLAVLVDRKLRTVTTNKFIASLAVSDLLVGLVVMPLSLHAKMHGDLWILGHTWCQFHLVTGVFSTTASIVHLVAISLDRYFAIMFPTEYQRHSVSTSTTPYVVMIWLMAFCVSSSLFMEQNPVNERICWIDNPQYLVLSSLLSFFLPGIIVVYMYVKIFQKLRNHQLYMFGQQSTRQPDHKRSLPRVIIEEVRSRRGSRLSQTGSSGGSPTRRSSGPKSERSPSQPEIHTVALPPQRWRSPTICAETFEHDRSVAAKKRVSIVPDPPSMDISSTSNIGALRAEHETAIQREKMEAELKLLQDEPRFRKFSDKCCERREREKLEKRRNSSDGRPNGVPIMLAFNKAYSEIRAGRRRASLGREDSEGELHLPLRFQLSTVYADEEENPEDTALNPNSIELTEIEKTATTAETSLVKDESMQESLSTDASLRPLLSLTTLNQPSKLETITLKTNNSSNSFRNHNRIPAPTFLMVPAVMSINTSALPQHNTEYQHSGSLQVPRLFDCPSPSSAPSNSSHSSYTSASGSSDTYRRISMNSYGSSLTDATDSTFEIDSRRSSAWSTLRSAVLSNDFKNFPNCARPSVEIAVDGVGYSKKSNGISRGKLRRIATQVTRAIRRKRRESMAIRRESRATRVVAAILMAFIICWLPYFCISVYRGISMGFRVNIHRELHTELYVATSWLGYAHSCFNPVIYMCLNKNFRVTLRRMLRITRDQ
ncbi:unnamed protein product, partial [Mesorhabditis belari]|uniref:G-protein coupled receptors family 1 profile domain-containing protein n=1 Tax=Mesorhabditis belari TaxID=2138241 RepID=A0AAF3J7B8_9BILA